MARLSINEMTTYRWSFEEDVVQLRAAGIPAIGVWRQKLADYGEAKAASSCWPKAAWPCRTCSGPAASPAATATPTARASRRGRRDSPGGQLHCRLPGRL